jgi:hypothetical protein
MFCVQLNQCRANTDAWDISQVRDTVILSEAKKL